MFQTCTLTEEEVRVCRAVVKICTLTHDVEERPPYAAEKRTLAEWIGPAKCGPKPEEGAQRPWWRLFRT